jgi:putative transposase
MPTNLHRYYRAGYLHFLTTSCYQRRALLGTPENRDLFLEVMERVRRRRSFVVVGYVVMPEHVHLLFSEPERRDPSVVMNVPKQSFARQLLNRCRAGVDPRQSPLWKIPLTEGHVWQHRFYDFVVFTEKKRVEKLRYMHRNPVCPGSSAGAGTVELEQLPSLRFGRAGTSAGQRSTEGGDAGARNRIV